MRKLGDESRKLLKHEEKMLQTLELCRQTYNYFLAQLNEEEKIPSRFELQAQLPRLKREKPELRKVYSKVLQMVLHQLYPNLRALSRLKKNGRKVGKLRFKKNGSKPSPTTRVGSS